MTYLYDVPVRTEPVWRFVIRWIFIVLAIIASALGLFIPLVFGILSAMVAGTRGRRWDTGLNFGTWFGPFYLVYLAFQPKIGSDR